VVRALGVVVCIVGIAWFSCFYFYSSFKLMFLFLSPFISSKKSQPKYSWIILIVVILLIIVLFSAGILP